MNSCILLSFFLLILFGIAAGLEGADDDSGSELLKNKASNEASEGNDFDIGRQMGPHLRKCETNTEAIRAPAFGNMTERQTRGVTQSVQRASNNPNFFSSKRINSCIIASERTRASCSLIIACLVLISYIDYPIFGTNLVSSESIIASRPLYIVLLTDITIVFARLYRQRGESSEEVQEESMVSQEDGHNWVAAVKLLERGLVVYQSIRGIFIDCSVYLVVVICGLSLV